MGHIYYCKTCKGITIFRRCSVTYNYNVTVSGTDKDELLEVLGGYNYISCPHTAATKVQYTPGETELIKKGPFRCNTFVDAKSGSRRCASTKLIPIAVKDDFLEKMGCIIRQYAHFQTIHYMKGYLLIKELSLLDFFKVAIYQHEELNKTYPNTPVEFLQVLIANNIILQESKVFVSTLLLKGE